MDTRKIGRIFRQINEFSDLEDSIFQVSNGNKVHVKKETYFLKQVLSLEMGHAEIDGLNAMRRVTPNVPAVWGPLIDGQECYIVLQFVDTSSSLISDSIYETMKSIYSVKGNYWGWHLNNYVGTFIQKNSKHTDFLSYFLQDRIEPVLQWIYNAKLIDRNFFNKIIQTITKKSMEWDLGKIEPRLIHGDFWSGNILQANNGKVFLIDPSVSYGHPEQDFAMALLFGGVPMDWVDLILKEIGLNDGFPERILFWQIYPLLVHVALFGKGYIGSLMQAVNYY